MLQRALPMMERTQSIKLPKPFSAEGITAADALDSIACHGLKCLIRELEGGKRGERQDEKGT